MTTPERENDFHAYVAERAQRLAQARKGQPATGRTVTQGRTAAGDKVRVYDDGRGWNATQGRLATPAEIAEVSR